MAGSLNGPYFLCTFLKKFINLQSLRSSPKGNNVSLDSKDQRSSKQMNIFSFCPRSCSSNLKQTLSGINIRMYACASPVGNGDAGGAGGAGGDGGTGGAGGAGGPGGVCRRDI